jgi:hypothetical protein
VRLAAVLSGAAAAVHLSVARLHFDEYRLYGVGFVVSGVLQLAWAVAVWRRNGDRRLLLAGLVLQLGIALVWVISRTAGLPYGPHPWDPESVGALDAQCTFDELLIVVLGVVSTRSPSGSRPRLAVDALELLALLATAATWFMLAAGAGHGH